LHLVDDLFELNLFCFFESLGTTHETAQTLRHYFENWNMATWTLLPLAELPATCKRGVECTVGWNVVTNFLTQLLQSGQQVKGKVF